MNMCFFFFWFLSNTHTTVQSHSIFAPNNISSTQDMFPSVHGCLLPLPRPPPHPY
jgi:hypothetical protein